MSDSVRDLVVNALSSLPDPPVDIESASDEGTWHSVITARDESVIWRFVCERSVWRLEAAPTCAPKESFDVDLLARQFLGRSLAAPVSNLGELMGRSVDGLVEELQLVRGPVIEAFRSDNWSTVRTALMQAGRQRDFELFGRPIPPAAQRARSDGTARCFIDSHARKESGRTVSFQPAGT